MSTKDAPLSDNPLPGPGSWDDFIAGEVYPRPGGRAEDSYRGYRRNPRSCVVEFYRIHHRRQTLGFVLGKKEQWLPPRRRSMTAMEALGFLNTLVDDSDPDIELDQLQHLLQTSEAIRRDGREDWFVLAGLLHDLGKVLCLFGEPQWAVVGDTHPVGCRFSDRIVFAEFLRDNPDHSHPLYSTPAGIYREGCGLDQVHMTWGHDEYLYHVLKGRLPQPALHMIRYHSFYSWHREGRYGHLCSDTDRRMLPWVQAFNRYDLYSKSPDPPDWRRLKDYYRKLIDDYLPGPLVF